MSRIHEALKKAEQERAVNQGTVMPTNLATTPVADPPVFAESPSRTRLLRLRFLRRTLACRRWLVRLTRTLSWLAPRTWNGSRIQAPCCS